MTAHSQSRQALPVIPLPWLTVEYSLWALLLITALGLRLLRLAAAPLNVTEARDALAAWRFAQGIGAPATTGYSPALFSAQWVSFLIFGADEISARLLPAIAGTALVFTPLLLRQKLGRLPALAASALLALSPTAISLSRTASGDVMVALGALLATVGLWHLIDHTGESAAPTIVFLLPFGVGLMLVSSPLAFSALLALGGALLLVGLIDLDWRHKLGRAWSLLRTSPHLALHIGGVLLGTVLLFSTAFAWHFGGLAAATDLLPQWLGGFVRWPESLSSGYPVLILILYEPLILLLGGVGAALAFVRGNATFLFLVMWTIIALLLALIRPGHGPGDLLLLVVPLVCLGGLGLTRFFEGPVRWLHEGLYLTVSAPLWAYLLINLATYSSKPAQFTFLNLLLFDLYLPTFLSIVVATALLLLILATGLGLIAGVGPALRGLAISTTLALLLYTVATGWGMSQNRPADPRELLVLEPTATEVRLLKDSLTRLSTERRGGTHALDLTLLTDDPALSWTLRDFDAARVAEPTDMPPTTSAVIAPKEVGTPSLGGGYFGQTLPLRRRWSPENVACRWDLIQVGFDQVRQLDCSALVDWFVFRRSAERPIEEQIVLWLRQDLVQP